MRRPLEYLKIPTIETSGPAPVIRKERASDHAAIFNITAAAFGQQAEAQLIEALRERASPVVSLVAELDDAIVGHILFTPVELSDAPDLPLFGLAPMAVAPAQQRRGIGSALVRAGLDACRDRNAAGIVVLGHPEYYPRFGFRPSTEFGIRSEYDVPDEVFMVQELVPGSLSDRGGVVRYHAAFGDL